MRKVTYRGKEYKVFQFNAYGETHDVICVPASYAGGELAIQLLDIEDDNIVDVYAILTVNLDCYTGYKDQSRTRAFLDTNNVTGAEVFVKKNGIAQYLGVTRRSGFCEYPLYKFELDAIYA